MPRFRDASGHPPDNHLLSLGITIDGLADHRQLYGALRHRQGSGPERVFRCLNAARGRWLGGFG